MAWSGEWYNIEGRSHWLEYPANSYVECLTCLSVLFLGCNLDATEETYNKDPTLSSFHPSRNNTILPHVLPVIMKNVRA